MAQHTHSLTPEQVKEVSALVDSVKAAIVSDITAAIIARQETVIAQAKTQIDAAVAKNVRVLVTTAADSPAAGWEGKLWEVLKLLLPVAATVFFGYLIWQRQSGQQRTIDQSLKTFQQDIDRDLKVKEAQLALKQAFFENKLKVYEETDRLMAELNTKVNAADNNRSEPKFKEASQALKAFNEHANSKRLYINQATYDSLMAVWQSGVDIFRQQAKASDLQQKIAAAEKLMAADLNIEDLAKIQ